MLDLERIVCAIDYSEVSRRALDRALGIARCYGSTVTAVHVLSPMPVAVAGPYYLAAAPPVTMAPVDMDAASRALQQFVETERVPGVRVDTLAVESPSVYHEILTQADRLHASLLVTGTHGRSGFERLFLGSVAEKVLRKARCHGAADKLDPAVRAVLKERYPADHATGFKDGEFTIRN